MRERLSWFAEEQAGLRKDGWCIEQVEKDFRIEIEGLTVSGVIDRIDRNEQNGMIRVLDYKTSSRATKVAYAHGKKIMSNTALPAHLEGVDEVIAELPVGIREKVVTAAWVDLQVPLYAYALGKDSLTVDEAGYFSLGAKKRDVKVSLWPDFSVDDQQAALRCAGWVAHQIRAKQFWPPSQSPKYDAFEQLKAGEVLDLIEFK
jgi:ATP-dependent helicase/nuclease subunit B